MGSIIKAEIGLNNDSRKSKLHVWFGEGFELIYPVKETKHNILVGRGGGVRVQKKRRLLNKMEKRGVGGGQQLACDCVHLGFQLASVSNARVLDLSV